VEVPTTLLYQILVTVLRNLKLQTTSHTQYKYLYHSPQSAAL